MIPDIGLLIGAYTFARLLEMITAKDTNMLVKVVSSFALIIVFITVVSLVTTGLKQPSGYPG